MSEKQINIVLNVQTSLNKDVYQKVDDALQSLGCITYDELTDDIWQAIKLLQKAKTAKAT